MSIQSIYPDIQTTDIIASRDFYVDLLGLHVAWEADWFIMLAAPETSSAQLALVSGDHESVPTTHQRRPAGVLITFEVTDVDAIHERAVELGLPIAQELRDEEFGQRHFMAVDPDGLLVDVVQTLFIPEQD